MPQTEHDTHLCRLPNPHSLLYASDLPSKYVIQRYPISAFTASFARTSRKDSGSEEQLGFEVAGSLLQVMSIIIILRKGRGRSEKVASDLVGLDEWPACRKTKEQDGAVKVLTQDCVATTAFPPHILST